MGIHATGKAEAGEPPSVRTSSCYNARTYLKAINREKNQRKNVYNKPNVKNKAQNKKLNICLGWEKGSLQSTGYFA